MIIGLIQAGLKGPRIREPRNLDTLTLVLLVENAYHGDIIQRQLLITAHRDMNIGISC